ncbi:MAG: hypothetical protein ACE5OZ_25705, partial [Candidatus Heimdallarchaeota archaeon]
MGKYLILWEIDQTKVQISSQERGAGWEAFMEIVKEDIEKGIIKDWGGFVGELRGFSIMEGTEVEIGNNLQRFVPFVSFTVHAVATHTMNFVKSTTGWGSDVG